MSVLCRSVKLKQILFRLLGNRTGIIDGIIFVSILLWIGLWVSEKDWWRQLDWGSFFTVVSAWLGKLNKGWIWGESSSVGEGWENERVNCKKPLPGRENIQCPVIQWTKLNKIHKPVTQNNQSDDCLITLQCDTIQILDTDNVRLKGWSKNDTRQLFNELRQLN